MGLSSSQARLLNLTTRMHQIEYKAAKLEAQKLQMANESRQVYLEYENALDQTKIQIKVLNTDGSATYRDINSLEDMMASGFTLVVHDVPVKADTDGKPATYAADVKEVVGTDGKVTTKGQYKGFAQVADATDTTTTTSDIVCHSKQELQDALNAKYYNSAANGTTASGEFNVDNVNFETLLTNLMTMGDVTLVQKMDNGDFPNPLEDGGNYSFADYQSSVATNTSFQEVTDETGLRKAEAKYEADMKRIDNKDTKYDYDLAALDNERNAIKQEMETLKTVAKDNVERTFKLFS